MRRSGFVFQKDDQLSDSPPKPNPEATNHEATNRPATSHQMGSGLVFAQLTLGMIAFGSATPVSKMLTEAMPVFVASGLRIAIGVLALLPAVLLTRTTRLTQLTGRDWFHTGLIALFGMFGFTVLMLYGMQMVSGVVGAIVMSTAPAVTACGAMLLLGEKATWRKLVAIGLAVLGVLVLHLGSGDGGMENQDAAGVSLLGPGILMVFAAVCCEAVYTIVGKKVSDNIDPVVAAFLAAAISLPLFLPFAWWQWSSLQTDQVSAGAWMALVWYGAGTLALGTWLWYSGVAKSQGSVAAGFMGVMPVSALVLSYVLLGETFRWLHLTGFAIVFTGVLLISWEHLRHQTSENPENDGNGE